MNLPTIKTIHTLVWAVMAAATFYIAYCGYFDIFNPLLWICIALIVGEGIVLLFNKWSYPLTGAAARYTQDRKDNFDIYLPLYVARYNKLFFTSLFIISIFLVIF